MTFSKICGLRDASDAEFAVSQGVDAIGLNLHPSSPRYVSPDLARTIADRVRDRARVVVLCVDLEREAVEALIHQIKPDVLQFHGAESDAFYASFGCPFWKAVPVRASDSVVMAASRYPSAEALLVDTPSTRVAGGTGKRFDWSLVPRVMKRSVFLAGGLDPDNVAEAITAVRPYGVDVASGVEIERGLKSRPLMKAFLEAVRGAG